MNQSKQNIKNKTERRTYIHIKYNNLPCTNWILTHAQEQDVPLYIAQKPPFVNSKKKQTNYIDKQFLVYMQLLSSC